MWLQSFKKTISTAVLHIMHRRRQLLSTKISRSTCCRLRVQRERTGRRLTHEGNLLPMTSKNQIANYRMSSILIRAGLVYFEVWEIHWSWRLQCSLDNFDIGLRRPSEGDATCATFLQFATFLRFATFSVFWWFLSSLGPMIVRLQAELMKDCI